MTLFLILGAAFLLGLFIGSVWGWRQAIKTVLREIQPLRDEGARDATEFMSAQRDRARDGLQ